VFCFHGERLLAQETVNRPADHMVARPLIGNHVSLAAEQAADGFCTEQQVQIGSDAERQAAQTSAANTADIRRASPFMTLAADAPLQLRSGGLFRAPKLCRLSFYYSITVRTDECDGRRIRALDRRQRNPRRCLWPLVLWT
jgi:NAD/ferredoxin-dependent reductase-like protein